MNTIRKELVTFGALLICGCDQWIGGGSVVYYLVLIRGNFAEGVT